MPQKADFLLERAEGAQEYVTQNVSKDTKIHLMCSSSKVKLQVYIPLELYEQLLEYIKRSHGGDRPHGSLSQTVAELLAWALDAHEHTTPDSRPPSHSRSWWKCQEIVARLKMMGAQSGSMFSQAAIIKVIKEVAGSDRRTIRKYLKLLVDFGFMETDGVWWYLR